ncbi:MAG: hypothetical protein IID42_04830, partial [Planctomycetes bacterium]|nr:hypothetical protein [Planctomycetota bacterium]
MIDPDAVRVYVTERKLRKKPGYSLRWIDPSTGKWRSKAAGTDRRRAVFDAANLERELQRGTYRDVRKVDWATFTNEVVGFKTGTHAAEFKRTLNEFGRLCGPASPRVVRFAMIRTYDQLLQERGNSVSTRNKKARYLRLAFREAVRLEYAAINPLEGWTWGKEDKHALRVLGRDEEQALFEAAESLYGFQMGAFVRFVLATWGRLAEVTSLGWTDVSFDDSSVLFRRTKSHEDRYIPLDPAGGVLDELRRL